MFPKRTWGQETTNEQKVQVAAHCSMSLSRRILNSSASDLLLKVFEPSASESEINSSRWVAQNEDTSRTYQSQPL